MLLNSAFDQPLPEQALERVSWNNLCGASVGLALSEALERQKQPFLIIAPDNLAVTHLVEALNFFSNHTDLLIFPDWETLPYDHFSPHQDIISERLSTLFRLPALEKGAIITTVSTFMHRLAPPQFI